MARPLLGVADMNLKRYLFALLSACGTQNAHQVDAGGCGTYDLGPATAISSTPCSTLCVDRGCPTGFCNAQIDTAGDQILTCTQDHTGRRPKGLVAPRTRGRGKCPAGRFFAGAAHLEAASVPAFQRVAMELAAFGAASDMQALAKRSAREEIRHAELMTRLAARCGARVPAVVVRQHRPRSLEAFARENAIEGCVKETYGAAIALHQSVHAVDREVRAAMREIARDEIRHAELAWQIDTWARASLAPRARTRVASAMVRAGNQLVVRDARVRDSVVASALGMPRADQRRLLVSSLRDSLWRT